MIDDDIDTIVNELRAIRRAMGDRNVSLEQQLDVDTSNDISKEDGMAFGQSLVVYESSDMENIANGGAVTVPSGETADIVYYEVPNGRIAKLMALGASNKQNLEYALFKNGRKQLTDWHEAPLGTYQDEFSLIDELNGYFTADNSITYRAKNVGEQDIECVGRFFIELE